MSQVTTHILDTTVGKPAGGVPVILYRGADISWSEISKGITDDDGRVRDLVQQDTILGKGIYKLRFEINHYFNKTGTEAFYPYVEIIFNIQSDEHYHVPLLLNPFGYSTYRGS